MHFGNRDGEADSSTPGAHGCVVSGNLSLQSNRYLRKTGVRLQPFLHFGRNGVPLCFTLLRSGLFFFVFRCFHIFHLNDSQHGTFRNLDRGCWLMWKLEEPSPV